MGVFFIKSVVGEWRFYQRNYFRKLAFSYPTWVRAPAQGRSPVGRQSAISIEETWSDYSFFFDQDPTDPSQAVIYAKLDLLHHQDFADDMRTTEEY